jgi:hypothetical protein
MVAGMEKSLSAHSGYDSVLSAHARTDPSMMQWPTNLNPADGPLSFHQYSTTLPSSVPISGHARHIRPVDNSQFSYQQQHASMQRTKSNTSTGIDDKATSMQNSIGEQKKKQPEISSAPHTKAQQQQSNAQQKRQAVAHKLKDSSTKVDLEQLVLSILSGSSEPSSSSNQHSPRPSKVFVSKTEAMQAAQMLSSIIKQSHGSAYSQPRKGSTQGFNANTSVCPRCDYAVARPCDLKKHMKRHEKPYGCTYPRCHKRFGAKSDWKRHENSQHFQLESFRCSLPSSSAQSQKECGEHFARVEHFKSHLDLAHKLTSEERVNEEIRRRRIGKNCQGQFWCGFEGKIIELKEKRNAAWDERFDHIAWHFEKQKRGIEDWVCLEENKTKGELAKGVDRYVFDDEEEEKRKRNVGKSPPVPPTMNQNPPVYAHDGSLKRGAPTDLSAPPKRTRHEPLLEMHHDAPTMARKDDTRYCVS